ncbi:MAG: hypothetical protein HY814_08705 [Candidatus Riflebacteria bacterium]|nr:hypothetical protein [Candidatus Riflebacteria bacterium]
MNSMKKRAVLVGAFVGTMAFLAAGLVPSLLYGRYLGVMIGASIKGAPLDQGGSAGYLHLVGMAVGIVSVWSLFIVVGAALGGLTTWVTVKAAPGPQEQGHNPLLGPH